MDEIQVDFERGVGDRFAEWLGSASGSSCLFLRRADQAPDLIYYFKGGELLVEITAAYYDGGHAKFLWKQARGDSAAPAGWSGVSPDKSLAAAIADRVAEKSKKRYGSNTVLLIEVPPGVTSAETLVGLLTDQPAPADTQFAGIYVVGRFPMTENSSGGYRVIPVKPII